MQAAGRPAPDIQAPTPMSTTTAHSAAGIQDAWRRSYQVINLLIMLAIVATSYRVWLTQPDDFRGNVQRLILSALFLITALEAVKLHFRSAFWLPSSLVPVLASASTCLAVWYVDEIAYVWVLTSMLLVYMRLPLQAARLVACCAYVVSLAIMVLYWQIDSTNLIRYALSGLVVQVMLSMFFQISRDLADRLAQTTSLLNSALNAMSQGITVLDKGGRVTLFNDRACELLDLPRTLLEPGPKLSEVVEFQRARGDFGPGHSSVPERARDYIASPSRATWEAIPQRYVRQNREGRFIEVKNHAMPTGDVVRTYSDVSEYEQVNRQLKLVLGEYRELSHSMLNRSRERMVIALTEMALHRDDETGEHIKRTQSYVQSLAQSLARNGSFVEQLSDKRIDLIVKATPMHDLGKVGIPDQVLLKPGRHTDDETRVMRTHATIGESILLAAAEGANTSDSLFVVAARMAGGHHENWDGSGYPRGQVGQAIPLEGRLMSLADVYDALTTSRVYKKAWTHAEASAYIVGLKGSKFDPAIVDAFEREASGFQAIARDLVHG